MTVVSADVADPAQPEPSTPQAPNAAVRWRVPWAALTTVVLLIAFEFGVARQDWFWGWVPYSQVGVIDALEKQVLPESRPLILFTGSSRVRDAISPRELEKALRLPEGTVLNLGLTMGTPFDTEILYRRNRDKLSQAKLVFFGTEPFQLDYNNAPTERILRFGTLRDRLKLVATEDRAALVVGWFWRTLDSGPIIQRLLRAPFKLREQLPPLADDGRVEWRTEADNRRARHRRASSDAERFFGGWHFSPSRQRQMGELFDMFAEDGMTVVVFQVPARDQFWKHAQEKYPDKVKTYSTKVREAASGHHVYMFWDGSEHHLRTRNFYDYGHLKPRPARTFTREIGKLIRKNHADVLAEIEAAAENLEPLPATDEDDEATAG